MPSRFDIPYRLSSSRLKSETAHIIHITFCIKWSETLAIEYSGEAIRRGTP